VLQASSRDFNELPGAAIHSMQHGRNTASLSSFSPFCEVFEIPMSIAERALDFLQRSEKVTVITATVAIGGVLCAVSERLGYLSFEGLDPWVRPAAQIVWLLSTVHFFIQCLLFLGRAIRVVGAWLNGIPQRRRKAAFERPVIQRLRDIDGLSSEMLCYALYKNDNHFWVSDDNARRAWLQRLRVAGLVNVDDANFGTVHYKIHPIAWAYMKLHPNQFINSVLWPKEPWIFADGREVEADAIVEKQVAENSRKTWWRFPKRKPA
jgi:hypothetical protein